MNSSQSDAVVRVKRYHDIAPDVVCCIQDGLSIGKDVVKLQGIVIDARRRWCSRS